MSPDSVLIAHAGTQIRPPRVGESEWSIVVLTSKRGLRVSPEIAALVVAFFGGSRIDTAIDIALDSPVDFGAALDAIAYLCEAGILLNTQQTQSPDHIWAASLIQTWESDGWSAAADYHLATYDYPFLWYGDDIGDDFDSSLMRDFEREKPDVDRTKSYPDVISSVPCPTTSESLEKMSVPFATVWSAYTHCNRLSAVGQIDRGTIVDLCAIVFGQLRVRRKTIDGLPRDLLRKTSPSGGARHPTEGYVAAITVDGLEPGFYHFAVGRRTLDLVAPLPPSPPMAMDMLFQGPYRCRSRHGFEPRAIVIFSSMFERNMYRYREPRTFRTVFLDVGHLTATLEIVAASMGIRCYPHHGVDDSAVEDILRLRGLEEGVIYAAALG